MDHEAAIQSLKLSHQQQLEQALADHQIKSSNEDEASDLKTRFDAEIEKLKESHAQELEQLKQAHTQFQQEVVVVEDLQIAHREAIEQLKREHLDEISKLKDGSIEHAEESRKELEQTLKAQLETELTNLHAKHDWK
ncbi:hypothetical protein G6F68_017213 [Rhizopus microsporus]|nr:hypothetical protein G6F68_017213 [Rhizopus microsporus]